MSSYPRTIYAIKHNITNRVYIGSTENIRHRYLTHMQHLRKGKHSSKLMQEDFDKYGENYSITILGRINDFEESYKEYQQMVKYTTFCPKYGYNQGDLKSNNALTARRHLIPHIYENLDNYSDTRFDIWRAKRHR